MVQNGERMPREAFELGEWTVHPSLNRLERDGQVEQLEPRVMDVLVCLATRSGTVVSREELLETVWPDAVIGEEGLTRRISSLRKVLGDDRDHPRYIETIRKGGYRLVAEVRPCTSESPPAAPGKPRLIPILTTIAVVAALAILLVIMLPSEAPESPAPDLLEARPLTSHPGRELMPAVSPDGSLVAYARKPAERGRYAVFVQQVGSESPIQLTNGPGHQVHPAWSADGTRVAYIQTSQGTSTIRSVATLGGNHRLEHEPGARIYGLTWLDDGSLVYAMADTDAGTVPLFRYDPATDQVTKITSPERRHGGDYNPCGQPGGSQLAFIRDDGNGYRDIYLVDLAKQEPSRRLTRHRAEMRGVAWWPDGRSLLVGSKLRGQFELWRVNADNGEGRPLPTAGQGVMTPAMARNVPVVVFEESRRTTDIWRLDLTTGETTPLIETTRQDRSPEPSPDGSMIAFMSNRSGALEIWVCDRDGGNPRQLSRLDGADVRAPFWSADGSTLAFGARRDGTQAVALVDIDNGRLRWVGGDGHHDRLQDWLPDGRLAVASDRRGAWELWSLDPTTSEAELITDQASALLHAFDDGSYLVMRTNNSSLWRLAPDGTLTKAFANIPLRRSLSITVDGSGLYLAIQDQEGVLVQRCSLDGEECEVLATLPPMTGAALTPEPGGLSLLLEATHNVHDDLLVVGP